MVDYILQKNDEDIESEFIYHYTDGISLLSILEKNELWLTERNYMNDVLEEEYVLALIRDKFKNNPTFQGSLVDRSLHERTPQYFFSTSTEKDLIHQWGYYSTTDSYCIEFRRHEIRDYLLNFKEKYDNLFYGPVIYDKEKAEKILSDRLSDYEKLVIEMINSNEFDPKNKRKRNIAKDVYQYFYSLIKQHGHYCEKEYRFVFRTNRVPSFKIKTGLFVPYIKIGGENENKIPINKIIIGPNNNEAIAIKSLKNLLDIKMYTNVNVEKSELKIRG